MMGIGATEGGRGINGCVGCIYVSFHAGKSLPLAAPCPVA